MMQLFLPILALAIIFDVLFFIMLPGDMTPQKKGSRPLLRPLYLLAIALAAWVMTFPFLILHDGAITTLHQVYSNTTIANVPLNCASGNTVVQPCGTTTEVSNTLTTYKNTTQQSMNINPTGIYSYTTLWIFMILLHSLFIYLYLFVWFKELGEEAMDAAD